MHGCLRPQRIAASPFPRCASSNGRASLALGVWVTVAMGPRDLGILLVLAALWGGSFLVIRVAAPVLGPLVLVEVRVALASIALLLFARALRQRHPLLSRWRSFLVLGTLNAAIPFTLIAVAELHLQASLAAILNATTPLFAAVASAVWVGERLTPGKGTGLVLGLVGVGIVTGWSPIRLDAPVLLSILLSLLAALSYALGGIYARKAFSGVPSLALATGQQLAATVLLLPFAAVAAPTARLTGGAALATAALALVGTAFAYLLYFGLLARVGATRTLSVTYLVPAFGILWSAIFLGERVHPGTVVGLLVILASVSLVTGTAAQLRSALVRRPAQR